LYDEIRVRLHNLKFYLTHKFINHEDKRADLVDRIGKKIDEVFAAPLGPKTYITMSDDDQKLYDALANRLQDLEFSLSDEFMSNAPNREEIAEKTRKGINATFEICTSELDLDCSPLCQNEQSECVPCEESTSGPMPKAPEW
jgi:hypothetical protein